MPTCDICGSVSSMRAVVEGAEVNVCNRCSRYGKLVSQQYGYGQASQRPALPEVELVNGFGKIITIAREKQGFSRSDLAKKLNMREADLLHFEEGKFKPTEHEAKKLESTLKIRILTSSPVPENTPVKRPISKLITLGDVVVIKDKRVGH